MKLESVDKAITIQSSNVHLGDRLPDFVRQIILRIASKYFGRLNTAAIHFSTEGTTYRCSVNMQMGALPLKSGEAREKDIYLAFNAALNKVAKQLRRTKCELREDKAERVDKDVILRERASPRGEAGSNLVRDHADEQNATEIGTDDASGLSDIHR
jgi:ribosomal subunit interface protein